MTPDQINRAGDVFVFIVTIALIVTHVRLILRLNKLQDAYDAIAKASHVK